MYICVHHLTNSGNTVHKHKNHSKHISPRSTILSIRYVPKNIILNAVKLNDVTMSLLAFFFVVVFFTFHTSVGIIATAAGAFRQSFFSSLKREKAEEEKKNRNDRET